VRLLELPEPPRVVGIDLHRARGLAGPVAGGVRFRRLDLTDPRSDAALAEILVDEQVDALVHLAFRSHPTPDVDYDHELETIGSLHVMHACASAKVERLVFGSTTMLYGPRPNNPNFLDEESPLNGHPDAHCVKNRVEAEGLLAEWTRRHPDVDVTVIRPCWVVGPTARDPFTRYFERTIVPVPLGYDPLVQLIHEDDALNVYLRAVLEPHPGVFNAVGRGVLPLSTLLALAGKRSLPLPARLLNGLMQPAVRTGDPPDAFFDYLRYLWVADGARGWRAFGEPVYSTKEAWMSFISSRHMRRYA